MAELNEDEDDPSRRRKRGLLKLFYGSAEAAAKPVDVYDINAAHFDHEAYLEKLFKERSLHELMDREADVVKQIRSLDSEMQTLVYENYSKFISATDSIKKMKSDFRKMEDQMAKLDTTLLSVTEFSDKVNGALHDKRSQIAQLSGVHTLLHKLQFLFELPGRLQKCMELKQFSLAVRYYLKARSVLEKYKHMPSFHGIHVDCEAIVTDLMQCLKDRLRETSSTTRELAECVDLLLKLGEPAAALCEEFLTLARVKVDDNLRQLQIQVELSGEDSVDNVEGNEAKVRGRDILDFMDCGCTGFLSDISLVIATYNELFMARGRVESIATDSGMKEVANEKLNSFIMGNMSDYFKSVRKRLELEDQTEDNTILVRALDKFFCKVQSVHQLFPESGMDRTSANIVAFAAHSRVSQYTTYLRTQFQGIITDTRQALINLKLASSSENLTIGDIIQQTSDGIQELVKSVLLNLKSFINMDITFSTKPYFRGPFCIDDIREGLIVNFLKLVIQTCRDFCAESSSDQNVPTSLLLILSKLALDFSESTAAHLLRAAEDWFPVEEEIRQGSIVTSSQELTTDFRSVAQELINQYVSSQGLSISQMMRKSVASRDWLNTIEPRTVRAVMKRVVEDITRIDAQVSSLFEEGTRKEASSESSKWTHNYGLSVAPNAHGYKTNLDNSLMSNIQKLFSERIEVFTSVEFTKVSVLTGIVKIALKTLLECIRLRTFSKFGLQQIQVDTHYLQLYMWRFVEDENLVRILLDESVNSAVHRCIEPEIMEPSVVEMICEKN